MPAPQPRRGQPCTPRIHPHSHRGPPGAPARRLRREPAQRRRLASVRATPASRPRLGARRRGHPHRGGAYRVAGGRYAPRIDANENAEALRASPRSMRVRAGSVSLARQQRGPDRPAGHRLLSHLLDRDARQRASRGSEASSVVASTWNFNSGKERKPLPQARSRVVPGQAKETRPPCADADLTSFVKFDGATGRLWTVAANARRPLF